MFENREISIFSGYFYPERSGKVCGHKPDVYAVEKSDIGVVPKKEPNKVGSDSTAEALEGRPVTEGNSVKPDWDLHTEAEVSIDRTLQNT
jgi:hypothetical protein